MDKSKHKLKKRFKEYISMDCYAYIILCSCGKRSIGWTPVEAEAVRKVHLKEVKGEK